MTKNVALIYGFCEGPNIAKSMLAALSQSGHNLVSDPSQADIIIAHSGGCYLVPDDVTAEQIILINLPYWPNKSLSKSLLEKIRADFVRHLRQKNIRTWLQKTAWNYVYLINMRHNYQMFRGRKRGEFWHLRNVTLIRNEEDNFCTPRPQELKFVRFTNIVNLSGQHDDCWEHPESYVSVIQ